MYSSVSHAILLPAGWIMEVVLHPWTMQKRNRNVGRKQFLDIRVHTQRSMQTLSQEGFGGCCCPCIVHTKITCGNTVCR